MEGAGDSAGAGGGRRLVCVTGGSGFIGSWLVRLLLDRGYTVHATVKNLSTIMLPLCSARQMKWNEVISYDEGETKHLRALDGADTRLRLFQMDLLAPASSMRPAKELLEPAVKGTLSVLRAAKDCGVARVVLMSSKSAMVPNPSWPADEAIAEDDCWADVELLEKRQLWYNVSKTLAEKAAWEFAEKEGLQLVVLNPGTTLGPFFTPSVNTSLNILLHLLRGQELELDAVYTGWVDVRDVARSAVVLYENPSAQGRHLCLASMERLVDFTAKLADLYPEFPVHRVKEDKQGWLMRAKDPSKKLIDLGVGFIPFDQTVRETVDCFRNKGLI
ncbi:cinnamoyl-CoA reductase 1-like isoform X1 [Panicum miliaceum]|uniref:Cinnamoyl-CoA reductase 1-like isoform X1 n=1 Tax=Panicum miliaceum TaxID=4540 RepID=A0A3L6SK34_PANMI|nr:cinnamoyl-CoA reductase 1-like isoform X1 [Panicum miliaceum]